MYDQEQDQGSDERTALLAQVYDREMDEAGDTFVSSVLRYRELDERRDGKHVFRLLWDSMSEALPIVVEVTKEDDEENEMPIHVIRVEASEWREAFEHPWAY
jgi:hypothetical protein